MTTPSASDLARQAIAMRNGGRAASEIKAALLQEIATRGLHAEVDQDGEDYTIRLADGSLVSYRSSEGFRSGSR